MNDWLYVDNFGLKQVGSRPNMGLASLEMATADLGRGDPGRGNPAAAIQVEATRGVVIRAVVIRAAAIRSWRSRSRRSRRAARRSGFRDRERDLQQSILVDRANRRQDDRAELVSAAPDAGRILRPEHDGVPRSCLARPSRRPIGQTACSSGRRWGRLRQSSIPSHRTTGRTPMSWCRTCRMARRRRGAASRTRRRLLSDRRKEEESSFFLISWCTPRLRQELVLNRLTTDGRCRCGTSRRTPRSSVPRAPGPGSNRRVADTHTSVPRRGTTTTPRRGV